MIPAAFSFRCAVLWTLLQKACEHVTHVILSTIKYGQYADGAALFDDVEPNDGSPDGHMAQLWQYVGVQRAAIGGVGQIANIAVKIDQT